MTHSGSSGARACCSAGEVLPNAYSFTSAHVQVLIAFHQKMIGASTHNTIHQGREFWCSETMRRQASHISTAAT